MSVKHVRYLWQDDAADKLSGLDRLVYRSNKLGEDLKLTNTGGGNTSSKLIERDPLTGQAVEVLWVKGSGGDLRTAKGDGFASNPAGMPAELAWSAGGRGKVAQPSTG